MSPLEIAARYAVPMVVLAPTIGFVLVSSLVVLGRTRTEAAERTVARTVHAALAVAAASSVATLFVLGARGFRPMQFALGHWFRADAYGFELSFLADIDAAMVSTLVAVLLLATSRFSEDYLHREPGYHRFFLLISAFAAGIQLIVLGGTLELLFAGWEVVGLTSVLLVGFFQERKGPVDAAVRVLVTYRLTDVGLLVAVVLFHLNLHTTSFSDLRDSETLHHASHGTLMLVGSGVLLAAMGKSAQCPFGGWLPRAMEGPTASSAVFYGSLSVHAGVYLLIRLAPLFDASPGLRVVLVLVGATTAFMAATSSQVSADAKTSLAYATVSQVGLMFVEIGLGLERLAIVHLLAHAILRYYQFLRTPSTLQDAMARRSAIGRTEADEVAAEWEGAGVEIRRFLYRLGVERFAVEESLERWIARPVDRFARLTDRIERSILGLLDRYSPEERR